VLAWNYQLYFSKLILCLLCLSSTNSSVRECCGTREEMDTKIGSKNWRDSVSMKTLLRLDLQKVSI